ncbi:hypothetical protein [Actinopolymorpha pittospori]|uniref:Holliday junction resolvase n=1 Tax=Actinopolymorpha pittospori TaxID=648752 RepID=A0A927MSS2_9ACTN|nr:hypothetical protein [Actinopolymorpha pittospori]MBE1606230.1 hypothetical protein [Actinopolymorpha pittospori]
MSNPAKARGTRWETALVRALAAFWQLRYGLKPFKPRQEGRNDVGDLQGFSPFIGQAKDWASWQDAIREGLDGAERQRLNAGEAYGVAFVKRARRPVGAGYAVMTVATWARLLIRLRRAEYLLTRHAPEAFAAHAAETAADLAEDFPS